MKFLPPAFIDRMRAQLGDEAAPFFASFEYPSPVSIRLHHQKGRSSFPHMENVLWCDTGYYLPSRPAFHLDPHWHAGAYYVQEASSMILDNILKQLALDDRPRTWLDLCAAPGGKTGILAKHMRSPDVLIANEVVPQRRHILRENLTKAGFHNTMITGEPASSFHRPIADILLIDAPCAGEGMMRKVQEAIDQWNEGLVQSCSRLQQEIVFEAAGALKSEGYLIYSTCSYSPDENIQNVSRCAEACELDSITLAFPDHFQIEAIRKDRVTGYQLYPHRVRGEGLFIAVLQNKNSAGFTPKPRKPVSFFEALPSWLAEQLQEPGQMVVRKNSLTNELVSTAALALADEVLQLLPKAEIVVQAGEMKGKDFIPSHAFAMSGLYHPDFPVIDVDLGLALDYLERQTATLPSPSKPGWHLIRYDGSVLGWAKYTPQGWKNHYPMAWRLRKRHPV